MTSCDLTEGHDRARLPAASREWTSLPHPGFDPGRHLRLSLDAGCGLGAAWPKKEKRATPPRAWAPRGCTPRENFRQMGAVPSRMGGVRRLHADPPRTLQPTTNRSPGSCLGVRSVPARFRPLAPDRGNANGRTALTGAERVDVATKTRSRV